MINNELSTDKNRLLMALKCQDLYDYAGGLSDPYDGGFTPEAEYLAAWDEFNVASQALDDFDAAIEAASLEQTYIDHVEELAAAAQTYDQAKSRKDAETQNATFQNLQSAWDRACEFLSATNQCRLQMRRDVNIRVGIA